MKILHLNNIAGVPETLAKEQNKRGHTSTVMSWGSNPYKFNHIEINQIERFMLLFKSYDIIHCHSCSLLPLNLDKIIPNIYKTKIVYHHHGGDIRYRSCKIKNKNIPHLVSTTDLKNCCSNSLYIPNPVYCEKWKKENDKYMPIQKITKTNNKEFLNKLTNLKNKLYDIPRELFLSSSLSGIQAESFGKKVYSSVPFPHEVSHVCDLLDYVYLKLL